MLLLINLKLRKKLFSNDLKKFKWQIGSSTNNVPYFKKVVVNKHIYGSPMK